MRGLKAHSPQKIHRFQAALDQIHEIALQQQFGLDHERFAGREGQHGVEVRALHKTQQLEDGQGQFLAARHRLAAAWA